MEISSDIVDIASIVPQNQTRNFADEKQSLPLFPCTLYDTEIVRKVAQSFLPGLASACVDNTSGDLFRTPASVAPALRREMADYVAKRSESFVAESVVAEGGPEAVAFAHPYDVIAEFVDEFAASKRSLFARVSSWLVSDKREDWIDDLVQEMEANGFWVSDRRETVARGLIKNIDFRNEFHCNASFGSAHELEEHVVVCGFRALSCGNEGCDSVFSERNSERHGEACGFKVVECEQKCSGKIMRREMDRHCVAVCPMRIASCPFYALGCRAAMPYCYLERHCSEELGSHLRCVLQSSRKAMPVEDLKQRVERLENASKSDRLRKARDVRSLTAAVKELEAELGPLKPKDENMDKETTETLTLANGSEKPESQIQE